MAPPKKRENRENNFYNIGVQGRKTGITLADKGVYDEHGLEPISGIFSSPERSPPKRGGNATGSESMEIQESSIPELATSHQILRNNRTHLPPPRARSPMKTALGSSPRRQSSMAPRGSSAAPSSPVRAASHPIARRLDFEQDESSLQETPALSGSGARRGKRTDVYDIPEDEGSPLPEQSAVFEESVVQEEITANEASVAAVEESFVAQIGEDSINEAEEVEDLVDQEESEIVPEPVKEPAKRGRKRKSDAVNISEEEQAVVEQPRKRGRPPGAKATASASEKTGKKSAPAAAQRRRSQRVSDISEPDPSIVEAPVDDSIDQSEQIEEAPVAPKRRGRPPRVQPDAEEEHTATAKPAKNDSSKGNAEAAAFKKPIKPVGRPKANAEPKSKPANADDVGKLVDVYGNPLSKKDLDQMSTTSAGSRFGRGRHLSVFREMDPDNVARVGRTGRHRVAPIDFWKNDHISYDVDGSMTSIVKSQEVEESRKRSKKSSSKGKKKALTVVEEEEIELDPWEQEEGALVGNYRGFDAATEVPSNEIIEDTIAWAEKGIQPRDVGDGGFKFAKIGSSGSFFNWGLIELGPDQMKRTKNSRYMHMVFNVQSGTVEVRMHENEFTVHKQGVWQVPRGNTYSIKNIGSGTARIFFAQARELHVQEEDEEE
ncbi:Mif2 multi-domain protein [Pyrenophora tritici-repentis]|nr:Mif2 multi-domain protein [Pyrenophora tritici-repentis]KAI0610480.1 Mif2 multi-domain protein [Pyrenophora tritici-repentis]KAI0622503.1 Mif2 multi-domain protein [Pyrenophora tritici-repentis]KAI2485131.1 Mif2 multi-domain protein [Pyrenophora tritici-repentis]